jgi:transposase-like protein
MAMSNLSAVAFKNQDKAREYLERLRWPNGVVCPHCGTIGEHYQLDGKAHRPGLWKCREKNCREQFSVTVGTVFERSHVPLSKWLMAVHLMCSSKKGMSAHQLHRSLGVTYKTAWFMAHRIREAMKGGGGLMGGSGKIVEADETYYGRKPGRRKASGWGHKEMVFSLVERGGDVRSVHITGKMFDEMKAHLHGNIAPETRLMTDEARMYRKVAQRFAEHQSVNHSKDEYVRGEAHTNTIEGFFSIFKRGMNGVYQHCGSQHLHRYLTEFDFRYNHRVAAGYDDVQRAAAALMGIGGKRLMYRDSSGD